MFDSSLVSNESNKSEVAKLEAPIEAVKRAEGNTSLVVFLIVLAIVCAIQLILAVGSIYVMKSGRAKLLRSIKPSSGMGPKKISTIACPYTYQDPTDSIGITLNETSLRHDFDGSPRVSDSPGLSPSALRRIAPIK